MVLGVIYILIIGVFGEFVDVVITVNTPDLIVTASVLLWLQLLQSSQVQTTQQINRQLLDIPQVFLASHAALPKLTIQLKLAQGQALQQFLDPLVQQLAALRHCDETRLVGEVAIHPSVQHRVIGETRFLSHVVAMQH